MIALTLTTTNLLATLPPTQQVVNPRALQAQGIVTAEASPPPASATFTFSTGSIAVPIPDFGSVDIALVVPNVASITNVKVSFRLNHAFDYDLVISLVHPDTTAVPLVTNRGGPGQNSGTGSNDSSGTPTVFDDSAAVPISSGVAPFAGTFNPESPVSALNGKPANGRTFQPAILFAGLRS